MNADVVDSSYTRYTCRKCRQELDVSPAVVPMKECCREGSNHHSCIYLDHERCPGWIQDAVDQSFWTKGKLTCIRCKGRLGSFDFLTAYTFPCKQHIIPPIHILEDRVDMLQWRLQKSSGMEQHTDLACSSHRVISLGQIPSRDRGAKSRGATGTMTEPDTTRYRHGGTYEATALQHKTFKQHSPEKDMTNTPVDNDTEDQESVMPTDTRCGRDHRTKSVMTGPNRFVLLRLLDDTEHSSDSEHDDGFSRSGSRNKGSSSSSGSHDNRTCSQSGSPCISSSSGSPHKSISSSSEVKKQGSSSQGNYQEVMEVPDEYTCAICYELYVHPSVCQPCGHVFCEPCLRRLCKTYPRNTRCPMCRDVIGKCVPNTELEAAIQVALPGQYEERCRQKINKSFCHLPSSDDRTHRPEGTVNGARNVFHRLKTIFMYILLFILSAGAILIYIVYLCLLFIKFCVSPLFLPLAALVIWCKGQVIRCKGQLTRKRNTRHKRNVRR